MAKCAVNNFGVTSLLIYIVILKFVSLRCATPHSALKTSHSTLYIGGIMKFLTDVISQMSEYKSLKNAVEKGRTAAATGLTNVHKANVVSALCTQLNKKALLLTGDEQESQQLANNISMMGLRALIYPLRDFNFRAVSGQSREYEHQRLMVLSSILKGDFDVVIACADAAAQFTIPPEELKRASMHIASGGEAELESLVTFLTESGYERCEAVEGEGHRPVRRAPSAVHGIGSEENFILPEIALKGDRTCGRGIVDLLSADLNAVLCFNEVVRELGPGSFAVPQRRAGQQAENQEQGHEFRCEACRSGAVLHVLHPPS